MGKKNASAPETVLHQHLPVLEVAEGWLLDSMLADAALARCVLTRLSDQVIVVVPGQVDTVLARLRKLGHTPKVLAE